MTAFLLDRRTILTSFPGLVPLFLGFGTDQVPRTAGPVIDRSQASGLYSNRIVVAAQPAHSS